MLVAIAVPDFHFGTCFAQLAYGVETFAIQCTADGVALAVPVLIFTAMAGVGDDWGVVGAVVLRHIQAQAIDADFACGGENELLVDASIAWPQLQGSAVGDLAAYVQT